MAAIIRDNGLGPEIVGTGVTVFDVMDGLRYRLFPSVIGQLLGLREDDVDAAVAYINANRIELDPAYEIIRTARSTDFPVLQTKLDAIENAYQRKWSEGLRLAGDGFPEWPDFNEPFIYDRGRGPEIIGSRITVYDIMDYLRPNWPAAAIAWWLKLTVPQVAAAIAFIEANRAEVENDYRIILERCARGNSPEVRARLTAAAGKFAAAVERFRRGESLREESGAEPVSR